MTSISGNRKTIEEILQNNSADLPIILMDHRPTQLQEVSQTAVNAAVFGAYTQRTTFSNQFYHSSNV
jgi:hypothetical protein